ncbi:DNA cytosine methyltransferase [Rhizobium sp. 2YAF20]|uniref:DNA cytosine methyltransferase n=1 Tax=Rhizobium sp. 2YAF20 TaxID=3233027 RepID=UPI003F9EBA4E
MGAIANTGSAQEKRSRVAPPTEAESERLELEKAASRVKIRNLRANMANSAVNLFVEVAKYAKNPHVNLRSFLRDCGIAPEDFRAFEKFSTLLVKNSKTLVSGRVKFEAIKALAAIDETSQRDALKRLESGDELSVRDIRRMQRDKNPPLAFEDKVLRSSARELNSRATKATRQMVAQLRSKADGLHTAMIANTNGWTTGPSFEMIKLLKLQDGQIRKTASELLVDFERLAGDRFSIRRSWAHLAIDNPAQMHLSQVHYSLKMLSRKAFRNGRFPQDSTPFYSWSSLEAIGYLAGKSPEKTSPIPVDTPKPLIAIDLCSGGGGHALGLEAAGYSVAGIFEQDTAVRDTLKINRPDWAFCSDITEIAELTQSSSGAPRQIDFLSAAIINRAWSATGPGRAAKEELSTAVSLVKELKPRSFMFEVDINYRSKKHTQDRTYFEDELIDAGYGIRTLVVSADKYGVPQKRTRAVIIGMLAGKDLLARLKLPAGARRSIEELLANVAFPDHAGLGPVGRSPDMDKQADNQARYNRRVKEWLADHAKADMLIPDVSKVSDKIKDGGFHKSSWGKSGFLSKFADQGPKLGIDWSDLPLTVRNLQRLQGFPDNWEFLGPLSEQIRQVSLVVPPQMIAALAGAIRQLLNGANVEYKEWSPAIQNISKPFKQRPPEYADRAIKFRIGQPQLVENDRGQAYQWQRHVDEEEEDWERFAPKQTVRFPIRTPRPMPVRGHGS